jgi:DNA invertase Pin-like site-specific DNA recombinase
LTVCRATQPTFRLSPATCSAPGAGIRSLADPFLDTTSDFAEIIFAILGVAAKLERRRILERNARGRADAKSGP